MAEPLRPPQPVFKDRIPPSEAPAARPPGERSQAVINKYQQRQGFAPFADTQPSPQEVTQRVETADQKLATANQELTGAQQTDNVSETGLNKFGFLRKLTGHRSEAEKEVDVNNAQTSIAEAEQFRQEAREDLEATQMYTPDYIRKESDTERVQGLIDANQRGGPMRVSPEMTAALEQQAKIKQDPVLALRKFYREHRIDIPESKMLPLEVFLNMQSLIGTEFRNPADVEPLIVMMSAANEVALEYSDERNLAIDQKKFVDAYALGRGITEGVTGKDTGMVYDFLRLKQGRREISSNDAGYYTIAAAQLEQFFRYSGIPEGEQRVPYIIAYTAGALANGRAMYLGHIARDLIADTLPYSQTTWTRQDGQWVEGSEDPKSRGLGSFITPRDAYSSWAIERDGTTDRGLVEVMTAAGSIVRDLDKRFLERRIDYNKRIHFDAQSAKDPKLLLKADN